MSKINNISEKDIHIVFKNSSTLSFQSTKELEKKYLKQFARQPESSTIYGLKELSLSERGMLACDLYRDLTGKELGNVSDIDFIDFEGRLLNISPMTVITDSNLIGTNYLNRAIYYKTDVEQLDGSFKEEERVYAVAGSYLSNDAIREALELEERYPELNSENRQVLKHMDQNQLSIYK